MAILALIAGLFISTNLYAGSSTGEAFINTLRVGDHGIQADLVAPLPVSGTEDCKHTGVATAVRLGQSHPMFAELYAALLMAHAESRPLSFYISGCSDNNWSGPFPLVSLVRIMKEP